MRKPYIDNIRWATVLLVLFYHVGFLFNGVGCFGGIPKARTVAAFDAMQYMIYPWFMVLLFAVAGMSARYSLQKRTGKQFIKERVTKLLIPSTLGLFVLHWVSGYLNLKMGGALSYLPAFLVYPVSALSGIGPLWFIQMLYLFSCVIILFRKLDKNDCLWRGCGKLKIGMVFLLFVVLWGASHILNVPVLIMYRFGIYFSAFLIGYYVLSHDEVQISIEKIRIPMLLMAAVLAVVYVAYYYGSNYSDSKCLQSLFTNFYLWVVILAVLGCGRSYFNWETPFTRYMSKSSFGLYIIHYPVLLMTCYILNYRFRFPAIWNYVIAMLVELVATFLLYETFKRIPGIKYLVLGIKTKKQKSEYI